MNNDTESRLYAVFREHPALIVSGFYVLASFVGMFWSWAFLRRFGIDVFDYAQISDFLLASLKEPFTWVLATYRLINNFGIIALVAVFIFVYATIQAEEVREGDGERVEVTFEAGGAVTTATLLGTTGQFMFLYDPMTERVDVHPFENVHAISFQSP